MLVGRAAEIAKARALLARGALVTLHGAPGMGKSAIAEEIARAARAEGSSAISCDLTSAETFEDVCFCVAGALDVSIGGGSNLARVIGDALGERLLVLDGGATNAAARFVREIAASSARVLVASREPLHAEGEVAVPIEPLSEPDARELFVACARRARPSFDPSRERDAITALVAALDGVPLAIVLAASRLAIATPSEVLARIHDTLDFLSAKRRDAPVRHASLHSAFESCFATLSTGERSALAQCAIFRGAFTLRDAEDVVALERDSNESIADTLQSLVEKSLLRAREEEGRGVRFDMLDIVRRLAIDSSGDVGPARDRHAAHFGRVGSTWDEANWYGGVAELPRLRAMQNDLLAAHAHAHALETAIALYPLFAAQGPHPAFLALLDEARDDRACAAADPALAARFLLVRGRGLQLCAMREDAAKSFEKSLQYARKSGRATLAARALAWLALARRTQGAMAEARERFEASAALFRDARDASSEAVVLSGLASLDLGEGDLDSARRALESAIDVLIRAGDAATAAMMRVDLAIVLQEMGDLEGARAVYEAALAAHRAAGNKRHEGITLGYLGTLEDEAGRVDAAEVALAEALAIERAIGDAKFVAVFAGALAAVRAERDDASGAREAIDEAERAAREGEARVAATVALHRLRVEAIALPPKAGKSGKSARSIAERRGVAVGLERQSDDVRFASRMLDRLASRGDEEPDESAPAMVVAEDASSIDLPTGKRVDLVRRAVHRRLVSALLRKRLAAPGEPVTNAELVAAGWPGEKLAESSAQNRLHVALATLRADGLRDVLVREPRGYLLDSAIDVRVAKKR